MRIRAIYSGTIQQHKFDLVDLDTGMRTQTVVANDGIDNFRDDAQIEAARGRLDETWIQVKAQYDTPQESKPEKKGK